MTLWDCNYCETINEQDAESCIACQAVKTQLVERPVLRHPLLEPKASPQASSKPQRSSAPPAPPRGPVMEPPHFPTDTPKKGFWKKVFGD